VFSGFGRSRGCGEAVGHSLAARLGAHLLLEGFSLVDLTPNKGQRSEDYGFILKVTHYTLASQRERQQTAKLARLWRLICRAVSLKLEPSYDLHLHTMQKLPRRARLLGRKVPL
jgi:hypothetical protein